MPVQVRPDPGAMTWRIRLLSKAPPLRTTPTWPPVVLSKPEKSAIAAPSRTSATTKNPPNHSPTRPAEGPVGAPEGFIRLFSLCMYPSEHPRSTIAVGRSGGVDPGGDARRSLDGRPQDVVALRRVRGHAAIEQNSQPRPSTWTTPALTCWHSPTS